MGLNLSTRVERWPIAGSFTISRGTKVEAAVVTVALSDGRHTGHGECVPYGRYAETVEEVAAAIEGQRDALANGLTRAGLQSALPHGAARNALDCAFWDLEAKRAGKRAWELAGVTVPDQMMTAYTISLGTPEEMARQTMKTDYRLLKLKLGGNGDPERLQAVRAAGPAKILIVDANEAWNENNLEKNLAACASADVKLVEQPLYAGKDDALKSLKRSVPICADESAHDRASLADLKGKYDAVNIKLDKAGGLTEALAMAKEAKAMGFQIMVGSMVSTSLGVAPATLLTEGAAFVDLDGPLLLAKDRPNGLHYRNEWLFPPDARLWG